MQFGDQEVQMRDQDMQFFEIKQDSFLLYH